MLRDYSLRSTDGQMLMLSSHREVPQAVPSLHQDQQGHLGPLPGDPLGPQYKLKSLMMLNSVSLI